MSLRGGVFSSDRSSFAGGLLQFVGSVHICEVFHQQAVDEDISATDAAQEDQVNTVVEEWGETKGEIPSVGNKK